MKYLKILPFVKNNDQKRKLHSREQLGIILGCSVHGIYKAELISSRKFVYTRHVTFDESSFLALEEESSSSSRRIHESKEYEIREEDISKHDVDCTMDSESDAEIDFNQSEDEIECQEVRASARYRPRMEVWLPDWYAGKARTHTAGSVITV